MSKQLDSLSQLTNLASQPAISRRSFIKTSAAAGAFAAAGGLLAACGSPSSTSVATGNATATEGTVTIWDRAGDLFQVFDATIESFNRKYPKIKVNHVSVDVDAKLPTTLNTGVNVPDGSFYEDNNLPILASHYYDITSWIQPYVKDIVPFKLRVNTYNNRIVGIPWDLDPGLLYYREDMLQAAGVDPASIQTYDDLIAAAKKVQGKYGPSCKPIHLEQDPGLTQLWVEMFANQQGTSMVDANGKLQINSPAYLNIMNFLKTVRDQNLGTRAAYYGPGDIAAIESNQVAFYPWAVWAVYGPDLLFKKTKGKWRAMPLPAWTQGGTRAAVMGGSSFIIPKKAKNPHLAWLFYEHLVFSKEGYSSVYGPNKVYPGGINTSIPSYLPALDTQLYKNSEGLGGQNLWQTVTSTVKDIPGNFYIAPWYNQAIPYFGTNVQRLLDGQMTPQQVLQKSSDDIQTKLVARQ
ncbi:ABC transporter substrate-binding protein [Dictyobacter kobayashii]|uniref:Sugar transporter n=1 Tax=Dictyobacter kobayashii TaxID=2014872 RepID=A0A402AV96_9CHLR|nr:extracellular solute-binding protein [Dictyobacter kobayashii]GCE23032.1 sugar transporter [Dictyobacter kobayashii]